MRNLVAFCVALGIVGALFWLTRSKSSKDKPKPAIASGSASTPALTRTTSTEAPIKIDRVRQLDVPMRTKLREQIAAARAKARAAASSSSPNTPLPEDAPILLEEAGPLIDALKTTPGLMAKCYGERTEGFEAAAMMTFVSDPDLGAVIDTDAIVDKDGKPLEQKVDDCLRDTIESLALPPLPKGGRLKLQYTFKF